MAGFVYHQDHKPVMAYLKPGIERLAMGHPVLAKRSECAVEFLFFRVSEIAIGLVNPDAGRSGQ